MNSDEWFFMELPFHLPLVICYSFRRFTYIDNGDVPKAQKLCEITRGACLLLNDYLAGCPRNTSACFFCGYHGSVVFSAFPAATNGGIKPAILRKKVVDMLVQFCCTSYILTKYNQENYIGSGPVIGNKKKGDGLPSSSVGPGDFGWGVSHH